jgi:hypothetical protein
VSSDQELTVAREQFRALVEAEWAAVSGVRHNAKNANQQVEAANTLVKSWAEQGSDVVRAVLLPLLEADDSRLRYAAAAHLLNHGASERAVSVLEALVEDEESGRVRSLASGVLRVWRRNQASAESR